MLVNSFENKVVEAEIGISYSADPAQAVALIQEQLSNNPNIVSEPAPQVGIASFGDSSVNIAYRYWVPTRQLFETQFQVNAAVYEAFNTNNVQIPFPQREVTVLNQ
ncbi:hypothetical protein [Aliamphritea spongicola]